LLILFVYGVLGVLLKGVNTHLQGILSAVIDRNVQKEAVQKIFYLQTKDLEKGDSRELISRLTDDTVKNSAFLIDLFVNEIPRIYYSVSFFIRIIKLNQPTLAISALLIIPVIILCSMIAGKVFFKNRNAVQEKIAKVTARLAEKIDNIELIKSYGTEEKEILSGDEVILELDKVKRQGALADQIGAFIKNMIWWIPVILMIVPPAILKFKGEMDTAGFFAYIMLVTTFRTYVSEHLDLWNYLKQAQGATLRLSQILQLDDERSTGEIAKPESGNIEFRNVSFGYGEEKVLDDVSFIIEKGKKTAIVGLSGSGKSTILNLIEKFYDPDSGEVSIAGKDVKDLQCKGYRSLFSYLPQNAPAFSGTIREVLNYSDERPHSDEQLYAALRTVGLEKDVEKLGGLEHRIGYNGETLSGGQRQKLGIARMLLSDKEYVLLDEATSALDPEATLSISAKIDEVCQNKTQILVAHDLSTVRNADKILLIDKGKILAEGTHQELLDKVPFYAQLVKEAA
jgi:ABC-type multidrug transport system fused ATPase/permease subunit